MDTVEPITERQREVARLVAEGRSNPEIAEALGVSLAGAKYHVSELLGRLGVSSRDEIAEWYRQHEGVPSGGGWRSRLRMLVPLGVLAAAGAGAFLVAVALEGGRDDSGAPPVTPTPTTVVEVVPTTIGEDGNQCVDLVPRGGSSWPTAGGLLQPAYMPDGWEVSKTNVSATDTCDVLAVSMILTRDDVPPTASRDVEFISFGLSPASDPLSPPEGDPVELGRGVVGYLSEGEGTIFTGGKGTTSLNWDQDGIHAALLSNSVGSDVLVDIAASASIVQATPTVTLQAGEITLFWEYEVEPQDTLAGLARRLDVSEETLIWNNVDLEELLASGEPNRFDQILVPGTVIRVPHVEGILHTVETDETVTEIADRYQVEPRDILEFEPNGLDGDPNNLEPGSTILVPGGQPPLGPASSSAAGEWARPVNGQVASAVGPEHPVGVDILAPLETEARAAADGVVTYAGGDPCCDHGLHVIIEHSEGYETLYGHLGQLTVTPDDRVSAEDIIGLVGQTGEAHLSEPHLHFELMRNGVYQDPLAFLPSPSSSP